MKMFIILCCLMTPVICMNIPISGQPLKWTELKDSIEQNDEKCVERFCKGIHAYWLNEALGHAARFSTPKIIKILLSHGASVNGNKMIFDLVKMRMKSEMPLCLAVLAGKPLNVKTLLNHGAIFDASFQEKIMDLWSKYGKIILTGKILISHGANIESEDKHASFFCRALNHLRNKGTRGTRFYKNMFQVTCFFLERGADPFRIEVECDFHSNIADDYCQTAKDLLVDDMLVKNSDTSLADENLIGMTTHLVYRYQEFFTLLKNKKIDEALPLLNNCGILRNLKDSETGDTLLHYCAQNHTTYFEYFFLRNLKGACSYRNHKKQTPIDMLIQNTQGQALFLKLIIRAKENLMTNEFIQ